MLVFFDNCVIGPMISIGIDPVTCLDGTEFQMAFTPDLKQEYEAALSKDLVPDNEKAAIRSMLNCFLKRGVFGLGGPPFSGLGEGEIATNEQVEALRRIPPNLDRRGRPGKRTDILLVAMAQNHIVVTNNSKEGHWRLNLQGKGRVIQWAMIEADLRKGASFVEVLRGLA